MRTSLHLITCYASCESHLQVLPADVLLADQCVELVVMRPTCSDGLPS